MSSLAVPVPSSRLSVRRGLLFSIFCGALLRFALALANLLHPSADLAYVQADNYMGAAELMRRIHDTTDPVFVPGYTLIVATFQTLFGSHAPAFLLGFECLLGIGCIPVMFLLARRIGGISCGLLAAFLVAIDPLLVTRSSLLMTESIYIPLQLTAVFLFVTGMSLARQPSRLWRLALLSSLVVGCSILIRSVGIIMPAAMMLAILLAREIPPKRKALLSAGVVTIAFLVVLPLCLHNKYKYGHFNVSSSLKFNYAALVVGPTKKAADGDDGPKLLSMWKDDIGAKYEEREPFGMADNAAHAATRWAFAHPLPVATDIVKGQLSMLFAPDRSSWAPGLSFLHLAPELFKAFAIAVALFRLTLSMLAIYTLIRWRSMLPGSWLAAFMLFVIVAHIVGVGAVGEGRYIAPVSPLIDLLAALTLVGMPAFHHLFPLRDSENVL